MMQTLILTFVVFLLAVLAMAAGVMVTGRSLKGSCGGPSCKCASEGEELLSCAKESDNGASLPMHSSQ